jgi:hypothetical protein
MNEEFDTLKNMIPACEGQEMHKLAILQASIDYTRYLEDCIQELQGHNGKQLPRDPTRGQEYPRPTNSALASPFVAAQDQYRRSSTVPSVDSPSIASSSRAESVIEDPSAAPTPTLLSPAFHAIHFSPEMSRQTTNHSNQTSPNILPQAAIEIDQDYHDATTALMMLNNDRRGLVKRSIEDIAGELDGEPQVVKRRPTGMSVKDLLSA